MVGNSIPENEEEHEVSDEDEAAEVQEETSQEKAHSKKKSKVKLSPLFSAVVGMKAVSYKGIEETLATGKISDIYIKSQIVFCPCNFNMKLCKSQIISVLVCMEQNPFKAPSFIDHIQFGNLTRSDYKSNKKFKSNCQQQNQLQQHKLLLCQTTNSKKTMV